jgi:salicylate hydroxylase
VEICDSFTRTGGSNVRLSVIHRADYHRVLLQEAERLGTRVVLNTKVVGLDVQNGIVTSEDHREVTADVIVGGDGTCRTPTFGNPAYVVVRSMVGYKVACA